MATFYSEESYSQSINYLDWKHHECPLNFKTKDFYRFFIRFFKGILIMLFVLWKMATFNRRENYYQSINYSDWKYLECQINIERRIFSDSFVH